MSPKDGYALLRTHWAEVTAGFFAGTPLPPAVADRVRAAFDSTIAPRLNPWLSLCCEDFFGWLDGTQGRS